MIYLSYPSFGKIEPSQKFPNLQHTLWEIALVQKGLNTHETLHLKWYFSYKIIQYGWCVKLSIEPGLVTFAMST